MLTDKRLLNLTDSYIGQTRHAVGWNLMHAALILWLWLLLPCTALAQWPAALQLTPDTRQTEVTPQLAILIDKDARLSIEQVAATAPGQWSAMERNLSLGFTQAVVWLRLDISPLPYTTDINPAVRNWLLEVTQPSLTDVRMYQQMPDGRWRMHMGTSREGMPERAYEHRSALFDLPTPHSKAQTIYLRLETPTSMSSMFVIWEAHAFGSHSSQETFVWGLIYGFCILMVLFHWAFSFWSQKQLHLIYALYILATFSSSMVASGWQLTLLNGGSMEQWLFPLGAFFSLAVVTGITFGVLYLDVLETRPIFAWMQIGCSAVISVVCVVGVAFGYYNQVIPWGQLSLMILVCINIVLAVLEWRCGNRKAILFLWAFGTFYVGVIIRLLRNQGLLEPTALTENSYQVGALLHVFLMSYGILTAYNSLQREKNAALTLAHKETEQRKEQADFLSMVSHELRTPITIISAALDNLKDSPIPPGATQKRIDKISRSTDRMQTLVDAFLNAERMTQTQFEPNKKPCNLDTVLQASISLNRERSAHPIALQQSPAAHFQCLADKELLRIALDNLLRNAIQHSTNNAPVTVALYATGTLLRIEVSNQGSPIAAEDLPYIFQRYRRGKNALYRAGTGLGLYVSHTIAHKHGGTLEAANTTDGCIFTLSIPLDTTAAST
jgi:two-component system, sensor histidine kinase LadS